MKHLFLLSKENVQLAKQEVLALVDSTDYLLNDNFLILNLKNNKQIKELSNRLAYTHEIHQLLFVSTKKNIEKDMQKYNWQKIYRKDFCLRVFNLNKKESELAGYIWNKVSKPKVNLENPTMKIVVFSTKKNVYCTLFLAETDKSYMQRKAHLRPKMHPVSLHPRLARAVVNLTGAQGKDDILDPFCGTGGILIEAGLMGLKTVGYDIDEKMLLMCKENLDYYNIKNYKLEKKDALKTDKKFDYVATDMPYGKNTGKIEDIGDFYLKFLLNLKKNLKKKAVVIFPDFINYKKIIKKSKLKIKDEFDYYIHKSMKKKILIICT